MTMTMNVNSINEEILGSAGSTSMLPVDYYSMVNEWFRHNIARVLLFSSKLTMFYISDEHSEWTMAGISCSVKILCGDSCSRDMGSFINIRLNKETRKPLL